MVTNGDNGTIGDNGANDDLFETMMIHWSYNCSNGVIVAIETIVTIGVIVAIGTIV